MKRKLTRTHAHAGGAAFPRVSELWMTLTAALTLTVALTLLGGAGAIAGKETAQEELASWLEEYVTEQLTAAPAAGATVLVGKGDELLLAGYYGYSDLENGLHTHAGSVYQIGSLTKQFTAVALLQLEQAGKLRLSDDIAQYLPEYPTHGQTITIEDLLYHTSGIPNYIGAGKAESRVWPGRRVNMTEWRVELLPEEMLAFFQDKPLEFNPGEGWNYSNAGYYLAGLIIEKVSGMAYGEYVEEHLFKPAGMHSSFYAGYEQLVEGRVRGYKVGEQGQLLNADPMSMTVPYAAGALSSTAQDLYQWNRALHEEGLLLEPQAYRKLVTPGTLDSGQTLPMNYALGIAAIERDGALSLIHPGGINGFSSVLSYFPEQQLTVVVLVNTYENKSPTLADAVEAAVSARLLGGGLEEFTTR